MSSALKTARLWPALAFALLALPAFGEGLPAPLAQALKSAGIPPAAVAIHVREVDAARPRLAINDRQPMNPASVMKLVTTFGALEVLGPAHGWKTEAWIAAPIDNGMLAGDLHLKAGGDPRLTFEQLWRLLRQLRAQGIREIRGDLVIDRSGFPVPAHDPGAFDGQPLRAYNTGADALLVNFNALRLTLSPDPEQKAVRVRPELVPDNLDIVNAIRLSASGGNGCAAWRDHVKADVSRRGDRFRLILAGSYGASCGERDWFLSPMPADRFALGAFGQIWRELGGAFAGDVKEGAVPASARLAARVESPPVSEIVRDVNKFSNNVMARHLHLALGGEAGIRRWLEARNLALPGLTIENGAGLSRQDRVTAEGLGDLLALAWKSPLMPEFIASLPIVAVDGTLKKRLNGNGVAGQAHIKGGTLDGVKAIAGYVLDRTGKYQVVVFLVNHPNAASAQGAQDALLQWAYDRGER